MYKTVRVTCFTQVFYVTAFGFAGCILFLRPHNSTGRFRSFAQDRRESSTIPCQDGLPKERLWEISSSNAISDGPGMKRGTSMVQKEMRNAGKTNILPPQTLRNSWTYHIHIESDACTANHLQPTINLHFLDQLGPWWRSQKKNPAEIVII